MLLRTQGSKKINKKMAKLTSREKFWITLYWKALNEIQYNHSLFIELHKNNL